MTVPKGASSGRMLRLRGRGTGREGKRGDQLVELRVVLPEKIDDDLAGFVRELAQDPRLRSAQGDGLMAEVYTEEQTITAVARLTRTRLRGVRLGRGGAPATSARGPCYSRVDIARLELLCDLTEGFELEDEALGLVVTLVDRLHAARADLDALIEAIAAEPAETRRRLAVALRRG